MQHTGRVATLGRQLQRHLLPLVVAAYVLAAAWPDPGMWVKRCIVADVGAAPVTLQMMLLAVLLFNGSVAASAVEVRTVVRRPATALLGVGVNLLIPLAFLFLLQLGLRAWHDARESDCLLLGLTIVAAMPVAGSSIGWSHNAGGNVALSLGLVIVSTFLSPLTTPLVLTGVSGIMPAGDPAVCGNSTRDFLLVIVVVPSALGLLVRHVAGDGMATRLTPALKAVSVLVLLVLCYSNATVALPQVVADPDWDFLALVGVAALGLCMTAFASGWVLARWLQASEADERSLMFGLGMNNNGTGLVLATSAFSPLPGAVLPVLVYNLIQHVVAGGVARVMDRRTSTKQLRGSCPATASALEAGTALTMMKP